jgi:hypothetical protein
MGAQQVLRVAVLVAVGLATARPAAAQSAEPVAVIDLRPGESAARAGARESFAAELAGVTGIQLVTDPELQRALAGEPPPPVGREARKEAARLMSQLLVHRSKSDCSARATVAPQAAALLAGLEAAGRSVGAELELIYAYQLGCADAAGDAAAAHAAADRLRKLGVSAAPAGVDAAVWSRYAAPQPVTAPVAVTVDGLPAGAEIWIDHARIGTAPVEVELAPGPHLLGAATDRGVTGRWFDPAETGSSIDYRIAEPPARWSSAAATVDGWRAGSASANALAIGALMREIGVRFAVVLSPGDRAELWTLPAEATAARRLMAGFMKAALPVANAVLEEVRRQSGKPADGDVQILTEPGKKDKKAVRQKWWVYASIIGAVAIGATIIVAGDLADDRQRVRLSWP